jgi:hypothetical protein
VSDFVNYNKRNIALPPGCKNLADVLALKSSPSDTALKHDKLSVIGEYISRAWESPAEDVVLRITPGKRVDFIQDPGLLFTLHRSPGGGLTADVQVRMDSEQEAALRLFLERHNYPLPDTSVPFQFDPNLPIEIIWSVTPFPAKASELAAVVSALLRQVCRLNDESDITVYYKETPHWD